MSSIKSFFTGRNRQVIFCIVCISVSGFTSLCRSENGEKAGETDDKWKFMAVISGALAFAHYDNWQAGGTDSINLNGKLTAGAEWKSAKSSWDNLLEAEYGMSKVEEEDSRKSVDKLKLETRYLYELRKNWAAYLRLTGKAPMTEGYLYYEEPVDAVFDDERRDLYGVERVKIADAFEPLTLNEGLGIEVIAFQEEESLELKFHAGAGMSQLFCMNYYQEEDDEETESVLEFSEVESYQDYGAESGFDFRKNFSEIAYMTSKMDGFYGIDNNFFQLSWENAISVSISDYFGITVTAEMAYDELIIEETQWKTGTLLTLSYKFL